MRKLTAFVLFGMLACVAIEPAQAQLFSRIFGRNNCSSGNCGSSYQGSRRDTQVLVETGAEFVAPASDRRDLQIEIERSRQDCQDCQSSNLGSSEAQLAIRDMIRDLQLTAAQFDELNLRIELLQRQRDQSSRDELVAFIERSRGTTRENLDIDVEVIVRELAQRRPEVIRERIIETRTVDDSRFSDDRRFTQDIRSRNDRRDFLSLAMSSSIAGPQAPRPLGRLMQNWQANRHQRLMLRQALSLTR